MAKVIAALCVTWLVAGVAIGVQGESELQLMQLAKITEEAEDGAGATAVDAAAAAEDDSVVAEAEEGASAGVDVAMAPATNDEEGGAVAEVPCDWVDPRCVAGPGLWYSLKDGWNMDVCEDSACQIRCKADGTAFNSDYGANYGEGKLTGCSTEAPNYRCYDGCVAGQSCGKHSYFCSSRGAVVSGTEADVADACHRDPRCTGYDWREVGGYGYVCYQTAYPGSSATCCGYKLCEKMLDCALEIDGGGWTLVRHTPGSGSWGPYTDSLAGSDSHGTPGGSLSSHYWTIPWSLSGKTEFLFAFGDCSQWLIASASEVNGEYYANAQRSILRSSTSDSEYTARWYNRESQPEDPWISRLDHSLCSNECMLYGEASTSGHVAGKNAHDGANVYVREATKVPTAAPTPMPTAMPTATPTEVPTDSPTGSPTDSPTPAPTPAPTQVLTDSPTNSPTDSRTSSPTLADEQAKAGFGGPVVAPQPEVGGTGDPHLRNVRGQRFDLAVPGVHVLLQIPRAVHPEQTLVRVEADAQELGSACADMYFQKLNVTGAWARAAAGSESGLLFSISAPPKSPNTGWIAIGKVDLKVVWGSTSQGIHYLNVYVRHLTKAGYSVGGLLGEDDHISVSTPPAQCKTSVALHAPRDEQQQLSGSIAEAM